MNELQLKTTNVLLLLAFAVVPAAANEVRETDINRGVERHLPSDETFMEWAHEPEALAADHFEGQSVQASAPKTVKLTDVVKPIYFQSGVANIPDSTVAELRTVLDDMRDRENVRLNLVGHADNQPLSPRLADVYGDNLGLSRERAGQVAEYFQNALALPAEAVTYEWLGDTQPIASNTTAAGRALNRRVAVEVWYDEREGRVAEREYLVVADMDREKVCRIETVCKLRYVEGHERRARVLNLVAPLHYRHGSIDLTPSFSLQVSRTLANLADKQNVVVKFVGYTDNRPLAGRTERIYGNHDALSKAKARRVALAIQDELALPTDMVASDGRGATRPLASNDTSKGQALNRRVEVEFWYDDPLQESAGRTAAVSNGSGCRDGHARLRSAMGHDPGSRARRRRAGHSSRLRGNAAPRS